MSQEDAVTMLRAMDADTFESIFARTLDESAQQYYSKFGGTTSSTDKDAKVADALEKHLTECSESDLIYYYTSHMPDTVSAESIQDVLKLLGVKTSNNPDFIHIYPLDFASKDALSDILTKYNDNAADEDKIEYTDIAGMLMSSVSSIITAISVVLIGFVSISLIVSSIMIGIITYISVLERTKEIGILRAVGASKRDISHVFNAETVIVGFLSGIFGISVTLVLCVPISLIARHATGITALTASLPWYGYLLILLSVALTLIAGLLPAGMAARKDRVQALRTE
jgi:putative ABC transport system permease protein